MLYFVSFTDYVIINIKALPLKYYFNYLRYTLIVIVECTLNSTEFKKKTKRFIVFLYNWLK